MNGKRISKTIPETAFCELGSVCFVVDSLITTDEFGNDITPGEWFGLKLLSSRCGLPICKRFVFEQVLDNCRS